MHSHLALLQMCVSTSGAVKKRTNSPKAAVLSPSLAPCSVLCCVQTLEEYSSKYKEEGEEFKTLINGVLPDGWADELPTFTEKDKGIATRLHSQTMLNALAPILPGFWGGSAGRNFTLHLWFLLFLIAAPSVCLLLQCPSLVQACLLPSCRVCCSIFASFMQFDHSRQ